MKISVILVNLFCKSYSTIILKIIEENHLEAGTLIHEWCLIPNGKMLLYARILPSIELVEHAQYTNKGYLKYLRWSSLWDS